MTLRRPDSMMSENLLAQADEWTNAILIPEPDEVDEPWTTARIRKAAGYALSRVRVRSEADLFEIAVSGVGLAVAIDPQCSFSDAVAAGQRDLWDAASSAVQTAGINRRTGETGPRVAAFWTDWLLHGMPEPGACENRMALGQVLDGLPDRHVDTLIRLAFTDSMEQAAATAGISPHAFRIRAQRARIAALALWFDHETPPALSRLPINRRGRDRTCPRGHLISGDNVYRTFTDRRVREDCKTCQDDSVANHRRLRQETHRG